jgi:hypothetical protein
MTLTWYTHFRRNGDKEDRLRAIHDDKRDNFNFPIVNFPFLCNTIQAAPAYGVYITVVVPIMISLIEGLIPTEESFYIRLPNFIRKV